MARILIGNIKGPKGDTGLQGIQGKIGPVGPQGPLPTLVNNALATTAGVAALDAVMGKTLQDQITQQNSNLLDYVFPYENYIIQSDTEHTGVLTISTTVYNSEHNLPHKVIQIASGGALTNLPSAFPPGTTFIGIRYIDYFNSTNILARLIEIQPTAGRQWFNRFNGTLWNGWASIVPS